MPKTKKIPENHPLADKTQSELIVMVEEANTAFCRESAAKTQLQGRITELEELASAQSQQVMQYEGFVSEARDSARHWKLEYDMLLAMVLAKRDVRMQNDPAFKRFIEATMQPGFKIASVADEPDMAPFVLEYNAGKRALRNTQVAAITGRLNEAKHWLALAE